VSGPDEALLEVLRGRRSIRKFRAEAPPREEIEALVEAAVLAPSASNRQPWRFFVAEGERIAAMAAAVRAAVARVAAHIDPESAEAFRAYGDYFTRFEGAPLVLAPLCRAAPVLSNLAGPTLPPDDRASIVAMEEASSLIGASLALQNLLLMAHARGLGASAMTGPLLAEPALRGILEVPAGWRLVALVPVGYPAEQPAAPERKPAPRVLRWLK
jgi:nitroreductase